MVDFLMEAVDCYCDSCSINRPAEIKTFKEVDLITIGNGFIIRTIDLEFQIAVTQKPIV